MKSVQRRIAMGAAALLALLAHAAYDPKSTSDDILLACTDASVSDAVLRITCNQWEWKRDPATWKNYREATGITLVDTIDLDDHVGVDIYGHLVDGKDFSSKCSISGTLTLSVDCPNAIGGRVGNTLGLHDHVGWEGDKGSSDIGLFWVGFDEQWVSRD